MLERGTHLHCKLYNGMDAYVLSVDKGGTKDLGNCIVTSNDQVNIVYTEPRSAISSIPLAIVNGSQWIIGEQPPVTEEELQQLVETASVRMQEEADKRKAKDQIEKTHKAAGKEILELINPKSALVAYYDKDKSDLQSDYHGSERGDTWVIGFSKNNRNMFPEMRKIAEEANVEEGDLKEALIRLSAKNPDNEKRENYSGGSGTYLADKDYGSRWKIEKWSRDPYEEPKICEVIGKGMLVFKDLTDEIIDIYKAHNLDDEADLFIKTNELNNLELSYERK